MILHFLVQWARHTHLKSETAQYNKSNDLLNLQPNYIYFTNSCLEPLFHCIGIGKGKVKVNVDLCSSSS